MTELSKLINISQMSESEVWRQYNLLSPKQITSVTMSNYVKGHTEIPHSIYLLMERICKGEFVEKQTPIKYSDEVLEKIKTFSKFSNYGNGAVQLTEFEKKVIAGKDVSSELIPLSVRRKLASKGLYVKINQVFELVRGELFEPCDDLRRIKNLLDRDNRLSIVGLSELILLPYSKVLDLFQKGKRNGYLPNTKKIPLVQGDYEDLKLVMTLKKINDQSTIEDLSKTLKIPLHTAETLWSKAVSNGVLSWKTSKVSGNPPKFYAQYLRLTQHPSMNIADFCVLLNCSKAHVKKLFAYAKEDGQKIPKSKQLTVTDERKREIKKLIDMRLVQTSFKNKYIELKDLGFEYYETGQTLRK